MKQTEVVEGNGQKQSSPEFWKTFPATLYFVPGTVHGSDPEQNCPPVRAPRAT